MPITHFEMHTMSNQTRVIGITVQKNELTAEDISHFILSDGIELQETGDGSVSISASEIDAEQVETIVEGAGYASRSHLFAQSVVPAGDAAVWRYHVGDGQTWTLDSCGLQDDSQAVPADADLHIYNETSAETVHTSTSVYEEPAGVSATGPADLRIELRNHSASDLVLSGQGEYTVAEA